MRSLRERLPHFAFASLLVAATGLAACGDDSDDPTPDAGESDTTPTDTTPTDTTTEPETTPTPDAEEPGGEVTLTQVYEQVFALSCGGLACHTGGGQGGGLDLDNNAGLTGRLLAQSTIGMPQVTPGDPENSYLYLKCDGSFREAGGSGSRMPLGAPPLSAADLELLRVWIETWDPT